ncbi:hydroxymethylglutaryl-CoA reductase, degradative [Candidatus Micrarchaeota archaeon CG10_big_fil_rev_8_21_14_0_10_45_29]|nr:MAG: hydroxymethylglutaryl-CoA reductase, degradative [Candidatus Micrarchaeota archaeon CG10_big_fil_rev_8_21_14_0_10_45_29]
MVESPWSGFYKLTIEERQERAAKLLKLGKEELALLKKEGALPLSVADKMSENVIGTIGLPLSLAPNFIINGKETVVPMAIEEPSVVAAASNGAKLCKNTGGFRTNYTGSIMIGQIQLVGIKDVDDAIIKIEKRREEIVKKADENASHLHPYGGGVGGMSPRSINTVRGKMLVVEFFINTADAMGANAVNTVLEGIAPLLEEITGGKTRLKILSNLATARMASAVAIWKKEDIGGEQVVESILDCWAMAMADEYRRATHNKGVMNGIDAVCIACGNDWRAVEAGAHTYSALKSGALTTFRKNADGNLEGKIVLPMAVGTVGGSLGVNPTAKMCLKILGVKSAGELAQVMAAVGLAQNFAALRALADEGIQKGHMKLHARHLASAAGAKEGEMEKVVALMQKGGKISAAGAKEALAKLRKK